MKKAIVLFCVTLFVHSAFASPLIFKTTKEINSPDKYVELFTLDTSKYAKVRISIDSKSTLRFNFLIRAIDGDDEFNILNKEVEVSDNFVLDTPPSKIRVMVWGSGTFKAAVWASQ